MAEADPPRGRRDLRGTFESAASLYHRARPDYPAALFDDLISLAALDPGDHLLEVGCGTGKATLEMARRGFRITALELGPELADAARRNLAGFSRVEVITSAFEGFEPPIPFGLVYAATAWHWIGPEVRYRKAWDCLAPGGHLAFWSATHVFPEGGDPFFVEIQEVCDEIGEGVPRGTAWPRPGELPRLSAEILASGLFADVETRQYAWEIEYTADPYIDLLNTFSGHIAMEGWKRDRLYGEIRRRLSRRPRARPARLGRRAPRCRTRRLTRWPPWIQALRAPSRFGLGSAAGTKRGLGTAGAEDPDHGADPRPRLEVRLRL